MTKVKILRTIQDKYDRNVVYQPGEEHSFDEARVANMVASGLVEIVPEPEPTPDTDMFAEVAPAIEAEPEPAPEVASTKKSRRK